MSIIFQCLSHPQIQHTTLSDSEKDYQRTSAKQERLEALTSFQYQVKLGLKQNDKGFSQSSEFYFRACFLEASEIMGIDLKDLEDAYNCSLHIKRKGKITVYVSDVLREKQRAIMKDLYKEAEEMKRVMKGGRRLFKTRLQEHLSGSPYGVIQSTVKSQPKPS